MDDCTHSYGRTPVRDKLLLAVHVRAPTEPQAELGEAELAAWRGLVRVHAALVRELDAELDARHGLPL